jgi:hypothetical protein
MWTLIKLLIAAMVVYGGWRAAAAYSDYYRFRDAVQEAAQFAGDAPDRVVHARVLEIASTLHLPVEADRVSVRRENSHTVIDAAYRVQLEILPTYRVPWEFAMHLDVWTASAPTPGERIPATP